jgi:DoxX-like family
MNQRDSRLAISALRWTLGLVVLLESVHFTLLPSAIHQFAKTGLPQWIRPVLGGSEIVAALLFLIPAVSSVGGCLLLFVFAIAVVIHFLHGELDVGGLVVYAAAVIVCLVHGTKEAPGDVA